MLTILHNVFDELPAEVVTRHLFIDAAAGVVTVRGEDKRIIGRTRQPWRAELVWNDSAGDYRTFTIVTGDPAEASFWAEDARAFFASADALGARLQRHDGNPLLPLLLSRFGSMDFRAGNGAQRRCESFYASKRRTRPRCEVLS
jgi:hypothetical protein